MPATRSATSSPPASARAVSGMVEADGRSLFLTVELPPPRLVLIGAVHISQALAPMARIAGFDMTIIDPRTAFATPERFPDVPLLAEWPADAIPRIGFDAFTAVAALTHDPKIDDAALLAALEAGCFYVGALGSRKTHAKRLERLRAAGAGEAALATIHAPIGLPHRRAVAGRDRGGDPRRGDRRAPEPRREGARGGGVKFGPVARRRRRRRDPRPFRPPRRRRPQEGHRARCGGRSRRSQAAGIASVVVARLEPGDVHEDEAAHRLAAALAGEHVRVERPFTGRSNLYAEAAGVLVVDRDRHRRGSTASTRRSPWRRCRPSPTVEAGRMVATVKMIPFAVAGATPRRRPRRAPAMRSASRRSGRSRSAWSRPRCRR